MKETITPYRFVEVFQQFRPDNFSKPALIALFEYLCALERDLGEETEFDHLALCCEWTEYTDPIEAAEAYGWETPEYPEGRRDSVNRKALEFLQDQTHVVEFDGGILVLNF